MSFTRDCSNITEDATNDQKIRRKNKSKTQSIIKWISSIKLLGAQHTLEEIKALDHGRVQMKNLSKLSSRSYHLDFASDK